MSVLVKIRGLERAGNAGYLNKGFRIKNALGPVSPNGVKATLTIGSGNAQVKYTAVSGGVWANTNVKIAHVDPSGASKPLTVTTTWSAGVATITVSLATASNSSLSSTAAQVIAAVNADTTAASLVVASKGTGTAASTAVTGAATALSGGDATGESGTQNLYSVVTATTEVLVDITDRDVQKMLKRNSYRVLIADA